MNGLLAIAETFLERMTNPQYGNEVNDQYSLLFSLFMVEDPQFADSFARLDLGPEDVDSLPTCAWPWYLQWRTERAAPPSAEFLDALFDSTDDPAVRLTVMQSAFSGRDPDREPSGHPDAAEDDQAPPGGAVTVAAHPEYLPERPQPGPTVIQNRWLRNRFARQAMGLARGRVDAAEMATYLLQSGDAESLAELGRLLGVEWEGQALLRRTIEEHLADAGLDPQTEANWRGRLGLPPLGPPPPGLPPPQRLR